MMNLIKCAIVIFALIFVSFFLFVSTVGVYEHFAPPEDLPPARIPFIWSVLYVVVSSFVWFLLAYVIMKLVRKMARHSKSVDEREKRCKTTGISLNPPALLVICTIFCSAVSVDQFFRSESSCSNNFHSIRPSLIRGAIAQELTGMPDDWMPEPHVARPNDIVIIFSDDSADYYREIQFFQGGLPERFRRELVDGNALDREFFTTVDSNFTVVYFGQTRQNSTNWSHVPVPLARLIEEISDYDSLSIQDVAPTTAFVLGDRSRPILCYGDVTREEGQLLAIARFSPFGHQLCRRRDYPNILGIGADFCAEFDCEGLFLRHESER